MTLYGKKHAIRTLSAQQQSGRSSHAVLLYGEEGIGRKTLARWLCALYLCQRSAGEGTPCLECQSCKKVLAGNHPDIITVPHYGVRGGYEVKLLQSLTVDAYVKPNDGEIKIYVFDDCDNISVQCQNILLKLIEEPPRHCRFIFTARSRATLLPTVLSRCTAVLVDGASDEECRLALIEKGYDVSELAAVKDIIGIWGGNIGRCLELAQAAGAPDLAQDTARAAIKAIASRDEYALLLAFEGVKSDKPALKRSLVLIAELIRDAAVSKVGNLSSASQASSISLDPQLAASIARKLTITRISEIIAALDTCADRLEQNGNAGLVLSAACSALI